MIIGNVLQIYVSVFIYSLLEQLPSKKWQVANNETKLPLPTEVLSMFKDNEGTYHFIRYLE